MVPFGKKVLFFSRAIKKIALFLTNVKRELKIKLCFEGGYCVVAMSWSIVQSRL